MSEKPTEKPAPASGAESPTTARELDFDDDNDTPTPATPAKDTAPKEEAPPAKPPRPMSPREQAEATLIEAFPTVESNVVKAVLSASGGQLEPAFNALLGMSDPNFKEEAPPQPPRPTPQQRQEEEDARLARRFYEREQARMAQQAGNSGAFYHQQRDRPNDNQERDEWDEIKNDIVKGFQETQGKISSWITNLSKKFDGDDDDDLQNRPGGSQRRQNFGASQGDQLYGIQREAERSRRSGDRDRYDADPQIISDDFTQLKMQDNDAPPQPPRPNRPLANPDLFKPTPAAPQKGPVDEVEALYQQPTPNRQPSPGNAKNKKWQPLTSVAPDPEADDHDPFSLGDSDDDDSKTKDVKAEDTERLKKAAASPVSAEPSKTVEAAERSGSLGTRNKEAEELLTKETK